MCSYTPVHLYTPRGSDTLHMSPILLCASVCSQRLLHVVGGCREPLTYWTPPLYGVPPHMSYNPPLIGWLPCASMFSGISTCDMGNIPLCLGFGGFVPPYVGGLGASAPLGVHMLHLVPSCSSLCVTYLPWL